MPRWAGRAMDWMTLRKSEGMLPATTQQPWPSDTLLPTQSPMMPSDQLQAQGLDEAG